MGFFTIPNLQKNSTLTNGIFWFVSVQFKKKIKKIFYILYKNTVHLPYYFDTNSGNYSRLSIEFSSKTGN